MTEYSHTYGSVLCAVLCTEPNLQQSELHTEYRPMQI